MSKLEEKKEEELKDLVIRKYILQGFLYVFWVIKVKKIYIARFYICILGYKS